MDFAARRRYYNLCDPSEPLRPEDVRNVDLDRLAGGAPKYSQRTTGGSPRSLAPAG
jgi:hypothetical protein